MFSRSRKNQDKSRLGCLYVQKVENRRNLISALRFMSKDHACDKTAAKHYICSEPCHRADLQTKSFMPI